MDAQVWRQAKGVLAEALLCPPNEREAFVNLRCPDADLRREVQAYLNEYDERFLESVLTVSDTLDSTSAAAAEAEQLPDIHIGDHIGPYVVLDRLGVGGMGHVFLGNDTRLQRKVALKCLIASASAAELRSRILHEARAAARITHPNIAIVHDVIEHNDRPFLVMEYVEGENLAAFIKRGRPSLQHIVAMIRQLASALAAAHAKGIIHRDLKPANIQVTPGGAVKILDFGVAHAMSVAASSTTTATAAIGLTVPVGLATLQTDRRVMHPGTPAYMSPEQMFGRAIDPRSDIYSLGVIVYEMATGHRPYSTDDPLEVVLTLSRNFLNAGDEPTTLPAQLNDVIGKMLAVKPEDRYQTAGELENTLVALTAPDLVAIQAVERSLWSRLPRVARMAVAVGFVPLTGGFLGFVTNTAYNVELDRPALFSDGSVRVWLSLGFGSLLTPLLVYVMPPLVGLWAVRFLFRLLRLSSRVDHLVTQSRTRGERLGLRIGLKDPIVLGQAVAAFGLIALVGILWFCRDVLFAVGMVAPLKPDLARATLPLVLGHNDRAHDYRMLLTFLVLALGAGAFRIGRLRQRTGRGLGALLVVVILLTVAGALAEVPYRFMWRNNAERVSYGTDRCYITGEQPDRLLLFCPDVRPHRNRIVERSDASVRRSGTVESIFTPPETAR